MKKQFKIVSSFIALVIASQVFVGMAADSYAQLPDPDGKSADMSKPVQVFIMLGQSNMLGFGKVAGGGGSLENAVKENNKYPYLVDDDGNWTVRKDVRNVRVMNFKDYLNDWLTISGRHIGSEIGIGHYVGNAVDAPVMLLKSCIGNRSLGWDLLPPGSEPYEYEGKTQPGYRGTPNNPQGNGEKVVGEWYAGKQYDDDIDSAKQVLANLSNYYPGAKNYEVAGFFFWQGAKDGGSAANSDRYEKNLVQFIKALRKEFNVPNAPFVVATMGQGVKGSGGNTGKITDAQLAVDGKSAKYNEFKGNVATFYANPVSMGGSANGHYSGNAETYMNVGEGMGRAMAELLETGGGASRPNTTTSGPESVRRAARRLAPGKIAALNSTLMKALVKLSDAGVLGSGKEMPLSLTRAKVSLISVKNDNTLTFRSDSGRKVPIASAKLKLIDFANLSVLVSKLKPNSKDALALAGVYLECMGRVELADKNFSKAGPESTATMAAFFE